MAGRQGPHLDQASGQDSRTGQDLTWTMVPRTALLGQPPVPHLVGTWFPRFTPHYDGRLHRRTTPYYNITVLERTANAGVSRFMVAPQRWCILGSQRRPAVGRWTTNGLMRTVSCWMRFPWFGHQFHGGPGRTDPQWTPTYGPHGPTLNQQLPQRTLLVKMWFGPGHATHTQLPGLTRMT